MSSNQTVCVLVLEMYHLNSKGVHNCLPYLQNPLVIVPFCLQNQSDEVPKNKPLGIKNELFIREPFVKIIVIAKESLSF